MPRFEGNFNKVGAKPLQDFIRVAMEMATGQKPVQYRGAEKPYYWPPDIDFVCPESRGVFVSVPKTRCGKF